MWNKFEGSSQLNSETTKKNSLDNLCMKDKKTFTINGL